MPSRVRIPDQVGFELGDHREDVEQQPPDWVVRVMHRAAVTELHVGLGEFAYDVAGVGEGAGEPVEFGDQEGVAVPAGGQRLAQPGPGPAGPGQAVVDVDAVRLHAERGECVALGGEVLGVGGAGVPVVLDNFWRISLTCGNTSRGTSDLR